MDEFYNKHYITLNKRGEIINGFSNAFRQPAESDICINEQGSYQFRLFSDGEENPPLYDGMSMIPLYKWDGEKVVRRTDEELNADRETARLAAEAAEAERRANSPEARLDALEDALCESDIATEAWRENIENALCELSAESED